MCLEYRALNNLTVKNKCPIPRIDEIFYRLQGHSISHPLTYEVDFIRFE
jgi:hypothetical protein